MESVSSSAIAGGLVLGAVMGAGLMFTMGIALLWYVLLIIAQWKIFVKAGEKGWKSLIPVYNFYITFRLFWDTKWFWIYLAASVVVSIVGNLAQNSTGTSGLILVLLTLVAAIIGFIIWVILHSRISKSFKHGVGFALGLIFLSDIFMLILGFNKDKYKKIKD